MPLKKNESSIILMIFHLQSHFYVCLKKFSNLLWALILLNNEKMVNLIHHVGVKYDTKYAYKRNYRVEIPFQLHYHFDI